MNINIKQTPGYIIVLLILLLVSCGQPAKYKLDEKLIASMGSSSMQYFEDEAFRLKKDIEAAPDSASLLLNYAETKIILHIFGYRSRPECIPEAKTAFNRAASLDTTSSAYYKIKGILHFLDWEWPETEMAFLKAIQTDDKNLNARHWYSLYLAAMGDVSSAMRQHDSIAVYDINEDYLVGKGSIYYFMEDYEKLKQLMIRAIEKNSQGPWPYDWLGMAYNGLGEHDASVKTYLKAFEISGGLVEVGAGLGHALGDAGEKKVARQLADRYSDMSKTNYLPYCQRSFIHISIGDYDKALELLEKAYEEKSWFLIFMQTEPWYDPIRDNERFQKIREQMAFRHYTG